MAKVNFEKLPAALIVTAEVLTATATAINLAEAASRSWGKVFTGDTGRGFAKLLGSSNSCSQFTTITGKINYIV